MLFDPQEGARDAYIDRLYKIYESGGDDASIRRFIGDSCKELLPAAGDAVRGLFKLDLDLQIIILISSGPLWILSELLYLFLNFPQKSLRNINIVILCGRFLTIFHQSCFFVILFLQNQHKVMVQVSEISWLFDLLIDKGPYATTTASRICCTGKVFCLSRKVAQLKSDLVGWIVILAYWLVS